MTPTIAMWIFGASLVPILGWGLHQAWSTLQIKTDTRLLVKMHRNPDAFGFGTAEINRDLQASRNEMLDCVRANTRAVNTLVHYIKWLAEKQTGVAPEPPLETDLGIHS